MSDREAHERTYTFFHDDGPVTLTEHELCNGYMQLRDRAAQLEAALRGGREVLVDARFPVMGPGVEIAGEAVVDAAKLAEFVKTLSELGVFATSVPHTTAEQSSPEGETDGN